jgi:DNA-nicking Smr family endonuclease
MLDPLLDARPDATLDLHGMSVAEGVRAVRSFVALWRGRRSGAVLHVITGKGRGSAGRPALRPAVRSLLRGALREAVRDWALDADEGGFLLRLV